MAVYFMSGIGQHGVSFSDSAAKTTDVISDI